MEESVLFYPFLFFFFLLLLTGVRAPALPIIPCAVPSSCSSLFNSPLTSNMSHSRNDNGRNMPAGKARYSPSILSRQLSSCLFLMDYFSVNLFSLLCFSFLFFLPLRVCENSQSQSATVVLLFLSHVLIGSRCSCSVGVQGSVPTQLSDWRGLFLPECTCPLPEWSTSPEPASQSHNTLHT